MDIHALKSMRETGLKFIADKFKEIEIATNITPETEEFQNVLQEVETKFSEIKLLNKQIEDKQKDAIQEEFRHAKAIVLNIERKLLQHRQGNAEHTGSLTASRFEEAQTSHPKQKKALPKTYRNAQAGSLQGSSHAEQKNNSPKTSRTGHVPSSQEYSHDEHKAAITAQTTSFSNEMQPNVPELKLYFMNAGFKSNPQPTFWQERNKVIYSLITENNPDIVCIQECEGIDMPTGFQYSGKSHAGIIINTETIKVSELEIDSVDIYQNLLRQARINKLNEYSPIERMHIKYFTLTKTGRSTDFICISWHGPSKHPITRGALSELQKIDIFEEWLLYLREIKSKYGLPIIVAGDYNVFFKNVKSHVVEPFRIHKYQPSERRKHRVIDFSIGYNISSGNDSLHVIELEGYPKAILDHDPVGGIFYFIDTSEKVSDEEEVRYVISPKKTTRGGIMLVSSDGYTFRAKTGDGQTKPRQWICAYHCPATVNEEKGRFNPGMRGHNHTPDQILRRATIN